MMCFLDAAFNSIAMNVLENTIKFAPSVVACEEAVLKCCDSILAEQQVQNEHGLQNIISKYPSA